MRMKICKLLALAFPLLLSACGTTYSLPEVSATSQAQAKQMFAQERARPVISTSNVNAANQRFQRVVSRVKPVAEAFCAKQNQEGSGKVCNLPVLVDLDMTHENAYHTRNPDGQPYIAFSVPMLMQVRNDDELAFVLGHEYAHHIADHIDKQQQQAMAGALIMGMITATGQAYATQANPYRYTGNDHAELRRSMESGAAAGQMAYSQSYELESDVLATHIAAAAGYDPVKGAKFFARPAPARTATGRLSFWGTHPPNATRLATVIETRAQAAAGRGLRKKQ